jgi:CheY-like chemotaxis protein
MQLKGLVVLVVEDDPDNLELLSSHLEGEGATVVGAASIAAALAMTSGVTLSALLSDLELPDGDGCELLRRLRERDGRNLPAIALTGYSDAKWRSRAMNCGFERYAVKPFALSQVSEWLNELTDRKSGVGVATCPSVTDPAAPARRAR